MLFLFSKKSNLFLKMCVALYLSIIMPKAHSNIANILFPIKSKIVLPRQNNFTFLKKIKDYLTYFHDVSIEIDPELLSTFIARSNITNQLTLESLFNVGKEFSFLGKLSLIDAFYISTHPLLPSQQRESTFCLAPNNVNFNDKQYNDLIDICKNDPTLNTYLQSIASKEEHVLSLIIHNTAKVVNMVTYMQKIGNGRHTKIYTKTTMDDLYGHSIFSDPLTLTLGFTTLMKKLEDLDSTDISPYKSNKIILNFRTLFFTTLCSFACNRIFLKKEYFFLYIRQYFISLANFIEEAYTIGNHLKIYYPEIVEAMPILKHLVHIKTSTVHSTEFNDLLKILDKNTFKGDEELTYFCSISNVKEAHKLFMSAIKEIDLIISAIGVLQLYQGTQKIECLVSNKMDLTKIKEAVIYFHNHTLN